MPQNARSIQDAHPAVQPRFGLIVSNGYGLGHVARMQAFAQGLKQFGPCGFMSLSAGLVHGAHYLPSAQYLNLSGAAARDYTRDAVMQFIKSFRPTHLLYDGNVVPSGLIAARARRPDIHLTWVRRGMWHERADPAYLAAQDHVDLAIEPGDLAGACDAGPTRILAGRYPALQLAPIKNPQDRLPPGAARAELGLDTGRHALIMTGAAQGDEDIALVKIIARHVRTAGYIPVIAHWPMAHTKPPRIEGAIVIECLALSQYYRAFDLIVGAAGYNAYHEILSTEVPCVFVPQEDIGRDNQLARAQFAQENRWAALCRRADIDALPSILSALAPQTRPDILWHADWASVACAMGADHGAPGEVVSLFAPVRDFKPLIRAAQKRRRGDVSQTRFLLAIDVDAAQFARRFKPQDNIVVVTNSVDPVLLRRMNLPYLWVNGGARRAMMRQVIGWITLWRPRVILTL